MSKLNPKKVGILLGLVFAIYYVIWAIALVLGGQSLLDNILKIHLMSMPITIQFTITNAIIGLIYHFVMGFIIGYIFIWLYHTYLSKN